MSTEKQNRKVKLSGETACKSSAQVSSGDQWRLAVNKSINVRFGPQKFIFPPIISKDLHSDSPTQLLLPLSCRVGLAAEAAAAQQHPLQAGPEQRRHAQRLLPSGAVHDDGVQTSEALSFQQGDQSLEEDRRHQTQTPSVC